MEHNKVKYGMKVVPHSKTADGMVKGLENSVVWKDAIKKGQPYLYVTSIRPKDDYPECILTLNYKRKRSISFLEMSGDYFLSSDFEKYIK